MAEILLGLTKIYQIMSDGITRYKRQQRFYEKLQQWLMIGSAVVVVLVVAYTLFAPI